MSLCYKCSRVFQNAGFFSLHVFTKQKFDFVVVLCRPFFKGNFDEPKEVNKSTEPKYKYIKSIDDQNFLEVWKKSMFDLNVYRIGAKNFFGECKKFCEENVEEIRNRWNVRVDNMADKVDILFKFETPEDIEKFTINTDSSFNAGYSSASLKITERETGLFSGYLNSDVPKTGNIRMAGWANFTCPKQYKSFFREKPYDWTNYTHLVLKVRGDGRTYLLLLHTDYYFEYNYYMYGQQLFTRGGPYWEVIEVPLAHFFLMYKGKLHADQSGGSGLCLNHITGLGLTAGGFEGSFKLEIDYIGLMFKNYQKMLCPFEQYKSKK